MQLLCLQKPIAHATDYIIEMYNNGTQFCNYGLANAIGAGAFNKEMITELKSRITTSKNCKHLSHRIPALEE